MQYKNDEKNSLISICQSTVTPILLIPYDSNSQKYILLCLEVMSRNDIKYMVKAYLQENGDDKNQFITDTMNNSLSPMGVITILKAFSDIIDILCSPSFLFMFPWFSTSCFSSLCQEASGRRSGHCWSRRHALFLSRWSLLLCILQIVWTTL